MQSSRHVLMYCIKTPPNNIISSSLSEGCQYPKWCAESLLSHPKVAQPFIYGKWCTIFPAHLATILEPYVYFYHFDHGIYPIYHYFATLILHDLKHKSRKENFLVVFAPGHFFMQTFLGKRWCDQIPKYRNAEIAYVFIDLHIFTAITVAKV